MTLIQTVWFRVMTFVWFPPPPGKENNFNLKVFFLQRIAATSRRMKKVPRILERKYIKLVASNVVSAEPQEQLRFIKMSKRFPCSKYFQVYLWMISNKGSSLRYFVSLMTCMMTMRVRLRSQKRMSKSRMFPLQTWTSSARPLSGYFTSTNLKGSFLNVF